MDRSSHVAFTDIYLGKLGGGNVSPLLAGDVCEVASAIKFVQLRDASYPSHGSFISLISLIHPAFGVSHSRRR